MKDCKLAKIPMDPNVWLHKIPEGDPRSADKVIQQYYIKDIGSLMYAAVGSHPDIAFPVSDLSKYIQNPGPKHITALKQVF